MAFKAPTPDALAHAERTLPKTIEVLAARHDAAVKALLVAADASTGPVDFTVTLAAIREYRQARGEVREALRFAARLLIAGGASPTRVCRELGIGRMTMQAFMAGDPGYAALLTPGKRPTRKAA